MGTLGLSAALLLAMTGTSGFLAAARTAGLSAAAWTPVLSFGLVGSRRGLRFIGGHRDLSLRGAAVAEPQRQSCGGATDEAQPWRRRRGGGSQRWCRGEGTAEAVPGSSPVPRSRCRQAGAAEAVPPRPVAGGARRGRPAAGRARRGRPASGRARRGRPVAGGARPGHHGAGGVQGAGAKEPGPQSWDHGAGTMEPVQRAAELRRRSCRRRGRGA